MVTHIWRVTTQFHFMLTVDTKRSIGPRLGFPAIKTLNVVYTWAYVLFGSSFHAWLSYMVQRALILTSKFMSELYWKSRFLSFLSMVGFSILGLFGAGHYENEDLCKCIILKQKSTHMIHEPNILWFGNLLLSRSWSNIRTNSREKSIFYPSTRVKAFKTHHAWSRLSCWLV